MGVLDAFKHKKSLDELEEENERLDTELSVRNKKIEMKRQSLEYKQLNKQLKPHGLSLVSFGHNIMAAKNWLMKN